MHERNVTSAQGTPWPWCVAACKLQPCIGRRCLFSVSCSALLTPKLLYRSPRLLPYQRWTVAPQRPTGCELCEPTPPAGVRSMARGPSVNATLAPRAATCKLRLYPPAGSQRDALSGPSLLCRRRHLLTHRMRRDGGGGAMRAGAFSLPLPLLCPLAMPHAIIARPSMSISWVSSHAIEIARVRFATAARGAARHGTHRACAPIRASGRQCSCVREDQLAWFEPVRPGLHGKECERSCLYLSTSSSCFFQYKVL